MVPPAPGLFSITSGWPRPLLMLSATVRPMMSVMLPAVKGTISRIGFVGQADCAEAPAAIRVAASTVRIRFMSCLLWNSFGTGCERLDRRLGLQPVIHLLVLRLELEAGVTRGLLQQHGEVDVVVAAAHQPCDRFTGGGGGRHRHAVRF